MKRKYKIIIAVVVILILLSGAAFYGLENRKKNKEEIDELYRIIRNKIGAKGTDIKSILDKVVPDGSNQKKLLSASEAIYKAFFWNDIFGYEHRNIDDDEDAVRNTLRGLTKREAKALLTTFEKQYGEELDDFLEKYNNADTLNTYYTIVQSLS